MLTMVVYTNQTGTKFIKVINANDQLPEIADDLMASGFHCYHSDRSMSAADLASLQAAINSLPLPKQIELANQVLIKQGLPQVNLAKEKETYQAEWDEPVTTADFEHELLTGEAGILDPLNEIYTDLTWREMTLTMEFLSANLPENNWYDWYITGYSNGEASFVWRYDPTTKFDYQQTFTDDPQKGSDYFGKNWQECLTTILYGSVIELSPCDQAGEQLAADSRIVGDFYLIDNEPNEAVDQYLQEKYQMKPVKNNNN